MSFIIIKATNGLSVCLLMIMYFLDPVHLSAVIQSEIVRQDTGVITVSVGDNVTLHCFYKSQVAMHFSWYRQLLGRKPELLFTIYKFGDPSKVFPWLEKNPRFSLQRKEGTNHLHISDIHLSDSATYYCGSSHSNMVEFGEGVFLSVGAGNSRGRISENSEYDKRQTTE
uniref:Ig-like domain-containing protein n=1 Tax=Acanthochromis polyacanthus TaxID=80966 RepID=A0A3Q1FSY0_9TELE